MLSYQKNSLFINKNFLIRNIKIDKYYRFEY